MRAAYVEIRRDMLADIDSGELQLLDLAETDCIRPEPLQQ